ncbi:MAG TPA: hypothetical protein DCW57_09185 [Planctomycetaceae bacterium]|nr:MAG: hypothetical protein CBC98_06220 [Planctomycetaceae bacterium TMED138]HAU49237.1 hypothetical protein [Planctomycetaceae bacterium]HBK74312.1 hypothetical protein [Planctomycetaceae bacterium]
MLEGTKTVSPCLGYRNHMLDVASLWFDILFNGRLSFRRYGGDEILLCIGGIFLSGTNTGQ